MSAYDDFMKMRKAAGMWDAMKGALPTAMAHGVAGAGVAAGIAGAGVAAGKIYNAITKSHDFKSMLENNQDLQEHYQNDPKRFNLMFTTLRTMNPAFSRDPLVAGTYMRRMVESPMSAGGVAVEAMGHATQPINVLQHAVDQGSAMSQKSLGKNLLPKEEKEQSRPGGNQQSSQAPSGQYRGPAGTPVSAPKAPFENMQRDRWNKPAPKK